MEQNDNAPDLAEIASQYREMTDLQLVEAAGAYDSYTDEVQGLLREEFRRRGLEAPVVADPAELAWRDLVTIRRYRDPVEAMMARGALQSAGIEAFLRDENIVRMDWFYSNMIGGLRLQVPKDDVDAAETVLSQPVPESFPIDDGSIYEQPKCPRCHSLDVTFEYIVPKDSTALNPAPGFLHQVYARKCHACGLLWQDDADDASDID